MGEIIGVLGQREIALPTGLYVGWVVGLAIALAGDAIAPASVPALPANPWPRIICLAASAFDALLIYWVQYLTWTDVGADTIEGVQGRYLLPIIFAVAFLCPRVRRTNGRYDPAMFLLPTLLLCAAQFAVIPMTIVRRYYLQ